MNDQHILRSYDRDLEAIQAHVLKMGGLVEDAILKGTDVDQPRNLAKSVTVE